MIEDFIVAELQFWALTIALLPVAAAVGLALVKYQVDKEVRERLRTGPRIAPGKSRTLPSHCRLRRTIDLKVDRRHA